MVFFEITIVFTNKITMTNKEILIDRTIYPALQPITSDWMHQVMSNPIVLQKVLERHGSPVNVHHLAPFGDNYQDYVAVFEEFGLQHLVLFARKANKSKCFVKEASRLGFGVDTASFRELEQCLELGCKPEKLVVTAAVKNRKLIELAIDNQVLIILDNADECELVQEVAAAKDVKAKVGFRISGFYFEGEKLYSRFGFDVDRILSYVDGNFAQFNHLEYQGLHFHLNGYSIPQRAAALEASVALADELERRNWTTKFIDIGGGLLMNYLKNKSQWNEFETVLKSAVQGNHPPITFQNNGLGFKMKNGELQGEMSVYPYYNETPRAVFLRNILNTSAKNIKNIGQLLKERNIEIRMEPGRSLLAQTGMTVAKVAFRKQDANDEWLVGLEMNMTQMYSSSADFLLDPFVIHQEQKPATEREDVGVYFTGAYCLERDVLLKRKIQLTQVPDIGDLVIFVNTAGYMMHFFESEAHLFELANNVVFHREEEEISVGNFILDADIQ